MEKEYLQLKISGLKKILLPKLENEVFHLTNQLGYEGIIRKRQIEHNKDLKFKINWGGKSFFRSKGCVSVCDLVHYDKNQLYDAMSKFYFLNNNNSH